MMSELQNTAALYSFVRDRYYDHIANAAQCLKKAAFLLANMEAQAKNPNDYLTDIEDIFVRDKRRSKEIVHQWRERGEMADFFNDIPATLEDHHAELSRVQEMQSNGGT